MSDSRDKAVESRAITFKMLLNKKKPNRGELLQLALVLGLLRADLDMLNEPYYLGFGVNNYNNLLGHGADDIGDVWTLSSPPEYIMDTPTLIHKPPDEDYQFILDDLNSLGQYGRGPTDFEIAAYVLRTTDSNLINLPSRSSPSLTHDSDSGISDGEVGRASSLSVSSDDDDDGLLGAVSPDIFGAAAVAEDEDEVERPVMEVFQIEDDEVVLSVSWVFFPLMLTAASIAVHNPTNFTLQSFTFLLIMSLNFLEQM